MANEEQLSILKQGVEVWNKWRNENPTVRIDLYRANISKNDLRRVDLRGAVLIDAVLSETNLRKANLSGAKLSGAKFNKTDLSHAKLSDAVLVGTALYGANLNGANFSGAHLKEVEFSSTIMSSTVFEQVDLREAIGLEDVSHIAPSIITRNTFSRSKGEIPATFLKGCGLSDWEIEEVKLYNPNLSNEEVNQILYKLYDLRATQALQISPLFISYNHSDSVFVDKVEVQLNQKGIRFWRDIHDLKAGRIEAQIDQAISQDRTVLLVLSEHSIRSDWVEHEVRKARDIAKEAGRDTLCPIALDDSWKSSPWPARVMEQIMEYNILDFSEWDDDVKFEGMFRKLIDGLELFYKG